MIRMDGTKMSKSKGNLIAPSLLRAGGGRRIAALPPLRRPTDRTTSTGLIRPTRSSTAAGGSSTGCGACSSTRPHRSARAATNEADPRRAGRTPPDHPGGDRRHRAVVVQHGRRPLPGALQRPTPLRAHTGAASHGEVFAEAADALLLLLAPMTPHVTAEIWEHRYPGAPSVHQRDWPSFDPDQVGRALRHHGRPGERQGARPHRGRSSDHRRGGRELALASSRVGETWAASTITRVVVRPPSLVNVVT